MATMFCRPSARSSMIRLASTQAQFNFPQRSGLAPSTSRSQPKRIFSNQNQDTLVFLYVKPPPPVFSSLDATEYLFAGDVIETMEKYGKDLANSVMSRAEAVYKNFNTNIKVEKKVGSGDAKDVICMAAEKLGADVLVMGSHDYGFLKRAFLGSVSDHCAKNVKCPLVVVKRPKTV
ncbi:hypothetical protein F0562_000777 [Nyssa sinensis]|uniref:UspA domain-containing protein n=1 Tax=Nyssa sinensis TaxID=561372 RepID=A0A5J5C126_9ASTE|nr:hypothetical protein F0562_000777 [Nyssa sinensis]